MLFAITTTGSVWADDDDDREGSGDRSSSSLTISSASWSQRRGRLTVRGEKSRSETVTLVNAFDTSQVLGRDNDDEDRDWRVRARRLNTVPCRVRAMSNGQTVERNVSSAPADCAPKNNEADENNPPPPQPANVAPTANANGSYNGTSGSAVSFSSAGSSDSDGTIDSYSWSFGDGASSSSANPSHTYTAAGSYTVLLVVTDNDGATGTSTSAANIVAPTPTNVAPTANANGPYNGTSGSAVNFSSAGSSDSDGTIDSYSWSFGDGASSISANPSHTYASAGSYKVRLSVTDNDGATGTSTSAANIVAPTPTNVAPTANASGPYNGTSGSAVNFSSAGSSDSDGTITSYSWSFGDGASSSSANPSHTYASAGNYTVRLSVTDNDGATGTSTSSANIVAPTPNNVAPTANANGPYNGTSGSAVNFSSAGSNDSDGTITSYSWSFGDGASSSSANPSHTYASAGNYTVRLSVTDNDGATTDDSTTAEITDLDQLPVACVETPGDGPTTHAECITSYSGPEVCVDCHEGQARDMHGSVHYQQGGAFPNVTNIPGDFASAGERPAQAAGDLVATGINTYCGTHENSPRFTCAGCHVGNGRFPMAQSEFELMDPASTEAHAQLANIDCLICHQDVYKRFPDWTVNGEGFTDLTLLNMAEDTNGNLVQANGAKLIRSGFAGIPNVDETTLDFQFLPAGSDTLPEDVPMAPMVLTTLEAAQQVHSTTRQTCLNCHAGAGGGDGTKRGDLSHELAVNTSTAMDFHMSPRGADLTCSGCHNETLPDGTTHRVRGRGLDLRPNDVAERFTCENSGCHTDRPHGDFNNTNPDSRDRHATKVACQTCHIPSYAKAAVGTEVARDWQDPHPSAAACNGRGGWLPREDKGGLGGASLIPSYAWFDGTSEVYYLGESLDSVPTIPLDANVAASFVGNFNAGDPAYVIGMPNGDVSSTSLGTKLYPMKDHWGKIARNDRDNTLIGHSTFEFFRTGSFCRAVAVGLGLDEVNDPSSSVCNGLPGDLEMPQNTTAVAVHTYQTINHGVETTGNALDCNDCHASTARMDLQGDLGYALKGPESQVCTQCHGSEDSMSFNGIHDRHVEREGKDCSVCHTFSRPERGLSTRLN